MHFKNGLQHMVVNNEYFIKNIINDILSNFVVRFYIDPVCV